MQDCSLYGILEKQIQCKKFMKRVLKGVKSLGKDFKEFII